eukprot:CAMPEP_0202052962 /NCGR_PEP_ID=MMETSP0963-20130614/5580_1 /ASSEMBLY_ACC=CAM_ASM_000494 /TAXON_ID=4773 /ORGANISM="Schizochytrium aggregatum, Strain ATCC28209" /LENGTH=53 /DNA_ID=CAMNT_0048618269 /DNA_START=114 /DNA_END=272 /DNA_ORIENTATION=-
MLARWLLDTIIFTDRSVQNVQQAPHDIRQWTGDAFQCPGFCLAYGHPATLRSS